MANRSLAAMQTPRFDMSGPSAPRVTARSTVRTVVADAHARADVWIVIPAYREASMIGPAVASSRERLDHVVIDDGSRDATAGEAQAAGAHVVRYPVFGQGAALQTGIEYALRLYTDYSRAAPTCCFIAGWW